MREERISEERGAGGGDIVGGLRLVEMSGGSNEREGERERERERGRERGGEREREREE